VSVVRGRYRLGCPVAFTYRGEEVAAQAASGAVRYDITLDPDRHRWYLHASWKVQPTPIPNVEQAVAGGVVAVDLNADHLACWAIDRHVNPVGRPLTIPLDLDRLSASTRDGHLRAAISQVCALARSRGMRAVAIEDLGFADAHAASVVIGRRALGLGARRRAGILDGDRRITAASNCRPGRPQPEGVHGPGPPGPRPRTAQAGKTGRGNRD
jgi:hypothetical protein